MGCKMTVQTILGPKDSITIAAIIIQKLLTDILSTTVTTVIMCSMLNGPHMTHVGSIFGKAKVALVAEAVASFFFMVLEKL